MASESNFVQAVILCFNDHYDHRSMLIESFLWSKEYCPIVEDDIGAPTEGEILTNPQRQSLKKEN